ncbi:MAG: squalene/phytoene synthase family protein [Candidatus Zixiibacteriota bacterium]|nr:MAG: squalene/phytoene synthase family protein [candidate division Zixibacteria bacterium]
MEHSDSKYLDFARKPDFKQILTNPILDIAARFWENDRYEAFKVCYRSMRVIDDLVDERKASGVKISDRDRELMSQTIRNWVESFIEGKPSDVFQAQLLDTARKFLIPPWPWQRLARAMIYDLNHDGFATFMTFLRYAEGAAVAPASVFMHLCGVNDGGDGSLRGPRFDVRRAARPLALFSYLVHIMRDFEKDQKAGLNYFADDLMTRSRLSHDGLRREAQAASTSPELRILMRQYHRAARYYRGKARDTLDSVIPELAPACQLSLEIIYSLYSQIFHRIEPENGEFTARALNPTVDEVQEQIYQTVTSFRPT